MKFPAKKQLAIAALGILLVLTFARGFAQTNGSGSAGVSGTVAGLRLPLSWWDNGKLKSQLLADKAKVPDNGAIYASGVTGEFYAVTGELDVTITTDDCTYDRESKLVKSDSRVKIERNDVVITGKGFEWNANEQLVMITNDVKVVMSRSMLRKDDIIKGKKK